MNVPKDAISTSSAMIVYTKARRCFIVHVIYNSFGPFFYSCPAAHSLYSKLLPTARDGFPPMHTIYCSLHLQLNFPGVSGVSTPASFGSSFHLLSGVSNQADFRAQLMLPMQIYLSCSCIWGQTYVRVAATLQK